MSGRKPSTLTDTEVRLAVAMGAGMAEVCDRLGVDSSQLSRETVRAALRNLSQIPDGVMAIDNQESRRMIEEALERAIKETLR